MKTKIDFDELERRMARKIASRKKIGWFDFCSDSYDMRVAGARAYRIFCRITRGERQTLAQAMRA